MLLASSVNTSRINIPSQRIGLNNGDHDHVNLENLVNPVELLTFRVSLLNNSVYHSMLLKFQAPANAD